MDNHKAIENDICSRCHAMGLNSESCGCEPIFLTIRPNCYKINTDGILDQLQSRNHVNYIFKLVPTLFEDIKRINKLIAIKIIISSIDRELHFHGKGDQPRNSSDQCNQFQDFSD